MFSHSLDPLRSVWLLAVRRQVTEWYGRLSPHGSGPPTSPITPPPIQVFHAGCVYWERQPRQDCDQ
ncbi:hypothetical protein QFZ94_002135 [Paraburkholderia sp. JPY465]